MPEKPGNAFILTFNGFLGDKKCVLISFFNTHLNIKY